MTNAQRSILSYLSEVEESVTDLIRFANMWSSEVAARRSLTYSGNYCGAGTCASLLHKTGTRCEKTKPEGA